MTPSRSDIVPIPKTPAWSKALWLRVAALLLFVSASVLLLISFLNYSNYRKTYSELCFTRHLVLAKDLRQSVVGGLNIGLSSMENVRLSQALTELVRRHDDVRYVAIIEDEAGLVGEGHIPANMKPVWHARLRSVQADSYWQASDRGTIELGLPFVNNFNVKTGAVIIGYERTPIEQACSAMLLRLMADIAGALLVLAVLLFSSVYLLMRRFSHGLVQVDAGLQGVLNAPEPPVVESEILEAGMKDDINHFAALTHHLVREMAQLERDVVLSSTGGQA